MKRVNIVMDNLAFLLHLRVLKEREMLFKNKEFEVKFYTLNLKNKKLISMREFTRGLENLES